MWSTVEALRERPMSPSHAQAPGHDSSGRQQATHPSHDPGEEECRRRGGGEEGKRGGGGGGGQTKVREEAATQSLDVGR